MLTSTVKKMLFSENKETKHNIGLTKGFLLPSLPKKLHNLANSNPILSLQFQNNSKNTALGYSLFPSLFSLSLSPFLVSEYSLDYNKENVFRLRNRASISLLQGYVQLFITSLFLICTIFRSLMSTTGVPQK